MIASPLAILLPLVLYVSPTSAADFVNQSRCGDCWCSNGGDTCPTDTAGITDNFSGTDKLYSTFELTNDPDFLKLQSASGGPCYPFADVFDNVALVNYEESGAEQCVSPPFVEETVCAYVYDKSSPTCDGRKYAIRNFPSTNDAMASNGAILHQGPCGVCSSAQDFGARIATYGTLETESIKCATSYTFTKDFPTLVSCYSKLGFSDSCATLWGHYGATSSNKCAFDCFPDSSGVTQLNGPAPACEPSQCLACQVDFQKEFDKIAGIEFPKAGITERIAHECSDFYRVIHDPCLGLDDYPSADDSPTPAESPVEERVETPSEDSAAAGNYIDTTCFATAATLTLSLLGTALVFV